MTIKKTLKFAFAALILAAGASAYAANEVTLKDGTTKVDWSAFVNAINNPSSLGGSVDRTALNEAEENYNTALQAQQEAPGNIISKRNAYKAANDRYTAANDSLTSLNGQMSALANKQQVASWLQQAATKATNFSSEYVKYYRGIAVPDPTISTIYYYQDMEFGDLYISFNDINGYTPISLKDFALNMKGTSSANVPLFVFVNLSPGYTVDNGHGAGIIEVAFSGNLATLGTNVSTAVNTLKSSATGDPTLMEPTQEYKDLLKTIQDKEKWINVLKDKASVAQNELTTAENDKDEADADVLTTKKAYDSALEAYNQAVANASATALDNYKTVTLNEDVTSTVQLTNFDGSIDGQGHVVTLSGVANLIDRLSGDVVDVAINGGGLARTTSGAHVNDVAWWNSTSATGRFYNDNGVYTQYTDLGALGFAARNYFGANLVGGNLVAKDSYKVYDITVYNVDSTPQYYVNLTNDDKFVNGTNTTGITIPVNTFVESKTSESAIADLPNVIINGNTCNNAEITDRKSFYCPKEITAVNLSYDRTFVSGLNVACLPFALSAESDNRIEVLCEFDRATPEKFYFTSIAGEVKAYTPILLAAKEAFSFNTMKGVIINPINTDQKVVGGTDEDNNSMSYGILKQVGPGQIKGQSQAGNVFGLAASDQQFHPAADNAVFPALRMVVYSDLPEVKASPERAPRRVVILDEMGVEIPGEWSAIESVEADGATAFEVVGGNGEISITSDVNYGKVDVYALDGKVAAVANVTEGTTTVSDLQSGVYIVMGKKVMVK